MRCWRTTVGVVVVMLATAGCNPYACTYETRFLGTSGSASGADGAVVVEYVNAREYDEGGPISSFLTWRITAERLASPARSLLLRDAQGRTVRQLTFSSTSATSMTASSSFDLSRAEAAAMFDLLATGSASVSLELENGASLSVPLRIASREDWHRPECG